MAIDQPAFSVFGPTDGVNPGTPGLVPAPPPQADGTWKIDPTTAEWVAGGGSGGGPVIQVDGDNIPDQSLLNFEDTASVIWNVGDDNSVQAQAVADPPIGQGATLQLAHMTLTSAQIRSLYSSPVNVVNGVSSSILIPVHAMVRHNPGDYSFGPMMDATFSELWWYGYGPETNFGASTTISIPGMAQSLLVGNYEGSNGPMFRAPAIVLNYNGGQAKAVMFGLDTASTDPIMTPNAALGPWFESAPLVLRAGTSDLGGSGLVTASVINAGTGYVEGDTFIVWGIGNGDATGHVTSVGEGGTVTGVAIDTPGSGYLVDSTGNFALNAGSQVGSGTNLQLSAASVDSNIGDGTIDIWVMYYLLPLS